MKSLLLIFSLVPAQLLAQVTNNEPCTAITVPVVQGAGFCQNTAFVLTDATFNPAYPANGCPSAPLLPNPADVWFKFVVPASGNVRVFTSFLPGSEETDAVLTAYSTPGNCSSILTVIGCDDDAGTGVNTLMPLLVFSGLQPDDTIFLQFYLYSGTSNGSFNICVTDATPPLATQNVGIGLSAPDSTLDVNGNTVVRGSARIAGNLRVNGNTAINGTVSISGGSPGTGKVLTSDATGNASWQAPASQVSTGTLNQTLRHNGTSWVNNSTLINDGSTVTVVGNLRITGGVPGTNRILTSDAAGTASWQPMAYCDLRNLLDQTFATATVNMKMGFSNAGGPGFAYTAADSTFAPAQSGYYNCTIKITLENNTNTGNIYVGILNQTLGSLQDIYYIPRGSRALETFSFSVTKFLANNNKYALVITNSTGGPVTVKNGNGSGATSSFTAYLLR